MPRAAQPRVVLAACLFVCQSAWLALAFAGCAPAAAPRPLTPGESNGQPRVPAPAHTLADFARAVERNDPRAAYALLHPRLRQQVDAEAFARDFSDNRTELLELSRLLQERELSIRAGAEVVLQGDEVVVVVLEGDAYRLAGGVLDAQARATPRGAVMAFRRALQRRDLDGLLRVLSRARRARWTAALSQGLSATSDPLDLEIEASGDAATATTPDGTRIRLLREAGTWQVADVLPREEE